MRLRIKGKLLPLLLSGRNLKWCKSSPWLAQWLELILEVTLKNVSVTAGNKCGWNWLGLKCGKKWV